MEERDLLRGVEHDRMGRFIHMPYLISLRMLHMAPYLVDFRSEVGLQMKKLVDLDLLKARPFPTRAPSKSPRVPNSA